MIRKLILGLLGLIVLLVVALVALVLVGPRVIDLRPRVEAALHSATGRAVRIAGPLDVSLVPALSVTAGDVHIANRTGGGDFATLGHLSLRMQWLPLLHGKMVIEQLTLDRPTLALAVDRNGVANWSAPAGDKAASSSASGGGGGGFTIALRSARIEHGRISYVNAQTGQKLTATDLSLAGSSADGATWRLAMLLNGERVTGKLTIDSLAALLAGRKARVAMSLAGKRFTMSFKGTPHGEPHPGLDGVFDLDVPSMGALFAWLDAPLAYDPGPLRMHLETTATRGRITLHDAAITGKAIRLTGGAVIDTTKSPPVFEASLTIPEADIDAYLPKAPAAPAAPSAPAAPAAPPAKAPPARSTPAPAAGWSTAPYDFSLLGKARGHLSVKIGRLRYRGQQLSDGTFDFTLGGRVLRLVNGTARLAGGGIEAKVTLDATTSRPRFHLQADLRALHLRPLLMAFAGTGRLAGTLTAHADLTATGANQFQLVQSLAGSGTVDLRDGALYGFDLHKSLRQIGRLRLATAPTDRTPIAALTASYRIAAGVLDNRDLRLASPLAAASGAGTVSLPQRQLDYTLRVRLAPGHGIPAELSRVEIPLRVTGAWRQPAIAADWAAALGQINLKGLPGGLGRTAPQLQRILPGLFGR